MIEDRVQVMVERLAERLERSVVVEDASFRPLAISAQLGVVDQSRIDYVLQRRMDTRMRFMVDTHGVRGTPGPLRIPPNDELGFVGRFVIPVLQDTYHVGYLWLIDEPTLTADQIAVAEGCAVELAAVIGDRIAAAADTTETAQRLVDDLMGAGRRRRADAADELARGSLLDGPGPYVLCVVRPGLDATPRADGEDGSGALRRVAARLRGHTGPRVHVTGTPRRDLVCVTTERRRDAVVRGVGAVAPAYVVGTRDLEDLRAARSRLADATFAAEVAAHVPSFGGAADWYRLGAYAALQSVERSQAGLERLCPGVTTLWDPGHEIYVGTLKAYLAEQGNVPRTAEALHVHRTTVYWRVSKVQQILGVDLSNGDDHLSLHLALKLSDLMPGGPAAK